MALEVQVVVIVLVLMFCWGRTDGKRIVEESGTTTKGKIPVPQWDIMFVFWSAVQLSSSLHNEKGSAWFCRTTHSVRHAFKFNFVRQFLLF